MGTFERNRRLDMSLKFAGTSGLREGFLSNGLIIEIVKAG